MDTQTPLYIRLASALAVFPGYLRVRELLLSHANDDDVCVVAGGAVRNVLLGRPIHDVDIFLSKRLLQKLLNHINQSEVHQGPLGSPRWMIDTIHHIDLVPLEEFDQGFGRCSSVFDILDQFDVTANAIAYDPRTNKVTDSKGGYADLQRRIMRAVRLDCPDQPMRANIALTWRVDRWFRIAHYSGTLGLMIEPRTLSWLRANRDCIRFRKHFSAIFFPPFVSSYIAGDDIPEAA